MTGVSVIWGEYRGGGISEGGPESREQNRSCRGHGSADVVGARQRLTALEAMDLKTQNTFTRSDTHTNTGHTLLSGRFIAL